MGIKESQTISDALMKFHQKHKDKIDSVNLKPLNPNDVIHVWLAEYLANYFEKFLPKNVNNHIREVRVNTKKIIQHTSEAIELLMSGHGTINGVPIKEYRKTIVTQWHKPNSNTLISTHESNKTAKELISTNGPIYFADSATEYVTNLADTLLRHILSWELTMCHDHNPWLNDNLCVTAWYVGHRCSKLKSWINDVEKFNISSSSNQQCIFGARIRQNHNIKRQFILEAYFKNGKTILPITHCPFCGDKL